jgi:transcriptional regulator with XRE-family HTH domain
MRIDDQSSDETITVELGKRLAALRLSRQITQAQLAHEAGISKRTVERIEDGESTQLVNVIRYLRALDALSALEALVPPVTSDPLGLIERRGQRRQRARPRATPAVASTWVWGEDK